MNMRLRAGCAAVAAVVVASLALAGCGSTVNKEQASNNKPSCTAGTGAPKNAPAKPATLNVAKDAAIAAQVPASMRGGTLSVAADASYPPNEFFPPGKTTMVGMDVDLGNAIADMFGMKVKFVNASFDGILAGLAAHKYDLGMSSFTDTKERQQTVDFVTYFQAGTSIMAKKCNPENIKTETDLCGKKVGAENGTVQLDSLQKKMAGSVAQQCATAGKKAPVASGYPDQTNVNTALAAGRIDAYLADTPVVDYAVVANPNLFQKVGKTTDVAPYGIAIPKDSGTLKNAVLAAVKKLQADGTYNAILKNWGVQAGAISNPVINGAQS
ncbi:MAG: ABC transporter substrate-binding protein [Mycobacterium sp.]|nr:ABC transporter substrate-binding protein [Mycobacterium sp.]